MHPKSIAPTTSLPSLAALSAFLRCGFAMCAELPTRRVETRAPLGGRIEWLCSEHALVRNELEEVLSDEPFDIADVPIPYTVTAKGLRAANASRTAS